MESKIKLFTRTIFIICMIFSVKIINAQNNYTIVARQIDSLRIAHNIPSIAYGVIRNDSIIAINTVGYRDMLTKEKAQSDDLYHIGSNTKSFTGFLAAKMVEDNLIEWDTKFFDLFPELKNESNPAYNDITLIELLSHRARLINFSQPGEIMMVMSKYEKTINGSLSIPEKRYYLVREVLKSEPLLPYDQCEDIYSNAGFIAAALMLEKVTGQTWESLMKKLSKDLKLDIHIAHIIDSGMHQPKGHMNPKTMRLDIDRDLIPVLNPVQDELQPLNGFFEFLQLCTPGGNISINVNDFLKFLQLNINGIHGEDNYLSSEAYKQIFSSYPHYSIGWWNQPEDNYRYSHRGSNLMFSSFAGISPEHNLGVVVMINSDDHYVLTQTLNVLFNSYAKM